MLGDELLQGKCWQNAQKDERHGDDTLGTFVNVFTALIDTFFSNLFLKITLHSGGAVIINYLRSLSLHHAQGS